MPEEASQLSSDTGRDTAGAGSTPDPGSSAPSVSLPTLIGVSCGVALLSACLASCMMTALHNAGRRRMKTRIERLPRMVGSTTSNMTPNTARRASSLSLALERWFNQEADETFLHSGVVHSDTVHSADADGHLELLPRSRVAYYPRGTYCPRSLAFAEHVRTPPRPKQSQMESPQAAGTCTSSKGAACGEAGGSSTQSMPDSHPDSLGSTAHAYHMAYGGTGLEMAQVDSTRPAPPKLCVPLAALDHAQVQVHMAALAADASAGLSQESAVTTGAPWAPPPQSPPPDTMQGFEDPFADDFVPPLPETSPPRLAASRSPQEEGRPHHELTEPTVAVCSSPLAPGATAQAAQAARGDSGQQPRRDLEASSSQESRSTAEQQSQRLVSSRLARARAMPLTPPRPTCARASEARAALPLERSHVGQVQEPTVPHDSATGGRGGCVMTSPAGATAAAVNWLSRSVAAAGVDSDVDDVNDGLHTDYTPNRHSQLANPSLASNFTPFYI